MAKKYWTFKGQRIPVRKAKIQRRVSINSDFNRVVRLTGRVNKRINTINIKYGKGSWATSKLLSRLDVKGIEVVKGGKIKIPKNLSGKKLELVESALKKFLNMKTSSVKGIESTIKKQVKNIQTSLSDETKEITKGEAETLYSFFEDPDFKSITELIPPSDLWRLLSDAKEKNLSEDGFTKLISNYIDYGNDEDIKKQLSGIYNKYVVV